MDLKHLTILSLQISILATVFGFGLRATTDDLLYLVRHPGLLVRSVVAVLVIMPLLALLLTQIFDFPRTVEIVVIALAISPVPPLLPNRETKAGGDASYGLGLMATLGVVSLVAIPASLALLGWYFGRPFAVAPSKVAMLAMMTVVLPLLAGVLVRAVLPGVAPRLETIAQWIAKILLPLGAIVLLAGIAPALWAATGPGTLAALVVFVVAGLAVGHLLAGSDPNRQVVLALSTACRHPAIALTIATAAFPDQKFGATIVLYLLLNIIVAIPYVMWQHRRTRPTPA